MLTPQTYLSYKGNSIFPPLFPARGDNQQTYKLPCSVPLQTSLTTWKDFRLPTPEVELWGKQFTKRTSIALQRVGKKRIQHLFHRPTAVRLACACRSKGCSQHQAVLYPAKTAEVRGKSPPSSSSSRTVRYRGEALLCNLCFQLWWL